MPEPKLQATASATWRAPVTLRAFLTRIPLHFLADIPLPLGMLVVVQIGESTRE